MRGSFGGASVLFGEGGVDMWTLGVVWMLVSTLIFGH